MPGDRDEEGRWRLLNPLAIKFSQPRIAPHFRDGRKLHATPDEVLETPLLDGRDAPQRKDAAEGAPPYDVVLVPPFPAIRVISWLPKIRRKDGEAERDENGDQIMGKRGWFALDNRRLHSLQVSAAKRWPRRCCVAVRCIEEVPSGSTMREIRKFRTTTEGRSVEVGIRAGETQPFSWPKAVPLDAPGRRPTVDDVVPEGFYAEDLFDALQWAPRSPADLLAAQEAQQEAKASSSSAAPGTTQATSAPSSAAPAALTAERLEERLRQGYQAARPGVPGNAAAASAAAAAVAAAAAGTFTSFAQSPYAGMLPPTPSLLAAGAAAGRACRLLPCPPTGWSYIDPSGNIQGPFGLDKMRIWYQHRFFQPELPMRCHDMDVFVPFRDLFPAPLVPFQDKVMRYTELQ
eukprot:TRINITY_DN23050_c0_g4_i1.p1 TRINITY_DN23050_c0_g4~~TRINITY_DN23050_c0_g4_i1.p1  ORF type:complete len:403 (+),score=82.41 TRINITY_DN23050_c0_g4_i1:100-1308(+)